MTVAAYALGRPRPAASRGGDCRARDLGGGGGVGGGFGAYADQYAGSPVSGRPPRDVHGPHRFTTTTDCQISNGMLRLTVGAAGAAPTLTVEARRGRITVDDDYVDEYVDIYGGTTATPAWFDLGSLIIDSPTVAALLTAVRLVDITPEGITIRLVSEAIADAFVTLERGMPAVLVQHGDNQAESPVSTTRRLRWTDSPSPAGLARTQRVEEVGGTQGLTRFVGGLDAVTTDAGAFSVTTAAVTSARLGAGVGTYDDWSHASALHSQIGDASVPVLVFS